MGRGSNGSIGTDTGACPIPPLPDRRDRYPWSLRTVTMSVGFSVVILSNLLLITVPPLIIPLALPITQAPPGTNLFLAKTDIIGNLEWSHSFGGLDRDVGYTVTECYEGGFAIAGETLSFGNGGTDVILVKTDILGKEMWMNTFGGPEDDRGSSIVRCGDGGYAISATTHSFGVGSSDMWLIRTDRYGQLMWSQTYGGRYSDAANSVMLCRDGGFLLVGKTQMTEYDPGTLFLVRLDSNGNQIWNESYVGSSYYGEGWSAVECSDGGFGVIGSMHTSRHSDLDDIWFLRFDSDGRIQWTHKHGGQGISIALGGYSVIECDDMGFTLAGKFGDQSSQTDIWLCRTDASGVVLWGLNYQGIHSGSGFLLGDCSDGGYVITGAVETPAASVIVELASNSIFNNGLIDSRRTWALPAIVNWEYKA